MGKQKDHLLKILFIGLVIIGMVGFAYARYTWISSLEEMAIRGTGQVQTGEMAIDKIALRALEGNIHDLDKPEYHQLKRRLEEMIVINTDLRFAYLFALVEDQVVILVDSEDVASENLSLPGDVYDEAADEFFQVFQEKETLITEVVEDRWGEWITVITPVLEPETGQALAAFAIDYPKDVWFQHAYVHTNLAIVISFVIGILWLAGHSILVKNHEIEKNAQLFKTVFEQVPIGISINEVSDFSGKVSRKRSFNPEFLRITGRSIQDMEQMPWEAYTHPEDILQDQLLFNQFLEEKIGGFKLEKRYIQPDGKTVWVDMTIANIEIKTEAKRHYLCLIQDITQRVEAQSRLKESERSKAVILSNLPGMAYRCLFDEDYTMLFVSEGCYELTGYKPESLLLNRDITFNDMIEESYRQPILQVWKKAAANQEKVRLEYELITADQQVKWVLEQGQPIFDEQGNVEALEGLIIDITDIKQKEREIQYLSEHDFLTGFFNRRYLEEVRPQIDTPQNLPISIIIGDINGLKLINDAFGHDQGDELIRKAADVFRSCCRETDLLFRTGGDEFTLILPNTDDHATHQLMSEIGKTIDKTNENNQNEAFHLNISIGHDTKHHAKEFLGDTIKSAEDQMYKRKLFEHKSSHSSIVASIKATMFERSQETEAHADRIAVYTKKIGEKLGLVDKELDELALFSTLHDLGKIGIDNRILNKTEKLTDEEWMEMKKHPEIGYRIAMASSELESVGEYILSHHERWDGKGYPRGLKGEEIPLLARILAVVDAYDAMTENRIYHKAMSRKEAIEEIKRNRGSQFDPTVVDIFIKLMERQS